MSNLSEKMKYILSGLILLMIGLGVFFNIQEKNAVDESKLPEKVELSKGFQRWITNLKNKGLVIEADEFNFIEKNEIYNSKWMTITSVDKAGEKEKFEATLANNQNIKHVVFSPSEREFIDFRNIQKGMGPDGKPFEPNEVRFYGMSDDKIIDARILDCSVRANCYFDRAYFLSNDLFVISEVSRNIDKHDETAPECAANVTCTYTIKIHVIDLINNSRLVYESKPFDAVIADLIPEL